MPDADTPPSLARRLEVGRLLTGTLAEMFIKAYGAGAALSVALSDAETVGGKADDAARAIPSLADKYDQARYVVDHREQIQAAITYLDEHTLPRAELERSVDESVATLGAIERTYDEVGAARDVLQIDGFRGTYDNALEAISHPAMRGAHGPTSTPSAGSRRWPSRCVPSPTRSTCWSPSTTAACSR